VKIHKLYLDAPMGSTVILTEEQYKASDGRRDELNKKYYERIQKLAQNKDKALVFFHWFEGNLKIETSSAKKHVLLFYL